MAWRMRVTFDDGPWAKEYLSPDIRANDPGWASEIFSHRIEKLEFFLPTGHVLVLSGMERYNFFIEAAQSFGLASPKLEAMYFCGKLPRSNIVETWRITMGKVLHQRLLFGREYGGGPTRGWKDGAVGSKPVSQITEG